MFKNKAQTECIAFLENELAKTDEYARKLEMRNTLINIERDGRYNRFTFVINGQIKIIETMGLLSDDLSDWKRSLGI